MDDKLKLGYKKHFTFDYNEYDFLDIEFIKNKYNILRKEQD